MVQNQGHIMNIPGKHTISSRYFVIINTINHCVSQIIIVLLLITSAASADNYPGGSHNQNGMLCKLRKPADRKSMGSSLQLFSSDIRINGKNNCQIGYGDSVCLEFRFFPGRVKALLSVYIDTDNNGLQDENDRQYGNTLEFSDGDLSDKDKKLNSYYKTIISQIPGEETEVNSVIDRMIFFLIDDGINKSTASLLVHPPISNWYVSGLISTPENKPNIGILAVSENKPIKKKLMFFSDNNGYFFFSLPAGFENSCRISCNDCLNILNNNYFSPEPIYYSKGNKTKEIIFEFSPKTSFIGGRITDQFNFPVTGVKIYARNIYSPALTEEYASVTDSSGFYKIGVPGGIYKMEFSAETIFPRYLYPDLTEPVEISEDQIKNNNNLMLTKTTGKIKGRVVIEDKLTGDIFVAAWNKNGSVWKRVNSDGRFELDVDMNMLYRVGINPENIPQGYYQLNSDYISVKSDTGKVLFDLRKAQVLIKGNITVGSGNLPLPEAVITATNGTRVITTRTDKNGNYSILGESGNYYIIASNDDHPEYKQSDTSLTTVNGGYHVNFHLNENKESLGGSNQAISEKFIFHQVYSDNNRAETVIRYKLTKLDHVTLKLYDFKGNEIATLEDKKKLAGMYEINLDNTKFSNGIYMYKLKTGSFSDTRKFIISK